MPGDLAGKLLLSKIAQMIFDCVFLLFFLSSPNAFIGDMVAVNGGRCLPDTSKLDASMPLPDSRLKSSGMTDVNG